MFLPIKGIEKTLRTHKHITIKGKIEMNLQQPAPQERPFKDYFSPLANLNTSCIKHTNVAVRSFELKPNVRNCLPTFYGLENENSYNHLIDFHVVCQIFKYEKFSDNDVKLRLFPFSLKDKARS